jgi:5-methylcytosine-specific restriction endonuclease McrA
MAIITLTPTGVPAEKPCTKCGETKPITDYHKRKSTNDGYAYWCKACQSTYDHLPERMAKKAEQRRKQYATDADYRQKKLDSDRNRYSTDPDHRERVRQRARDWSAEHHDHVLKKHREYWHTVVDKSAYNKRKSEQRRQRYKTDMAFRTHRIQEGRHAGRIRKARLRGAKGSFTRKEWEALCERYHHQCIACGKRRPLTADHIVPVSKGGANTIDNIQPMCMSCNARKMTKTIDYRPLEQSGFDWGD